MELLVRPVGTDLFYQAFFSEPIYPLFDARGSESLIAKLAKGFNVRLNDIKVNNQTPSDNFYHFSKLDGLRFLDVSYGLEQVAAALRNPRGQADAVEFYSKLGESFEGFPVSRQRLNIHQQVSTEGDAASFLQSLNPAVPSGFEEALDGRGVFYTLKYPDKGLTTHITVNSSIFVKGGIFLAIENDFSPNKYSFLEAFNSVLESRAFILQELSLKVEGESDEV